MRVFLPLLVFLLSCYAAPRAVLADVCDDCCVTYDACYDTCEYLYNECMLDCAEAYDWCILTYCGYPPDLSCARLCMMQRIGCEDECWDDRISCEMNCDLGVYGCLWVNECDPDYCND